MSCSISLFHIGMVVTNFFKIKAHMCLCLQMIAIFVTGTKCYLKPLKSTDMLHPRMIKKEIESGKVRHSIVLCTNIHSSVNSHTPI